MDEKDNSGTGTSGESISGTITLTNDKSPLTVFRSIMNNRVWYFEPTRKAWINDDGDVLPGAIVDKLQVEEGVVEGDSAFAFRALIRLQEIKDYIMNQLNTTKIFKKE